ncbi:MAG: hypothetical protein QOI47_1953 [Actinomycetota bacterium]|nr:hypothetical protein [Actinomycetota bacterium]
MSHGEPRAPGSGRWFLGALLAVVLTVIGVGCSSGASHAGNAAANTGRAERTTTTIDIHEQGVKYADCMRQNGFPDFPDPEASGKFPNFGINVSREQWTKTVDACKDLQPPSIDYSSDRSPAEQSAALKFAQCIRDHGVKDFPDPANGEPLVDTYKIPSSNSQAGMAILNAAMKKCGELLNAEARTQP